MIGVCVVFSCVDHFDFSDHVVLYMCHYLLPASVEVAFILTRTFSQRGSFLYLLLTQHWLPLLACVALVGVSLRALLLTSMFFHSPGENLVGLLVSWVGLVLPLMWLVSEFWACVLFAAKPTATLVHDTA